MKPTPTKFSDVLRDRIEQCHMSVAKLAALTGRTRTSVYGWLARNTFDKDRVYDLCSALNLRHLTPTVIENTYQVNWLAKKRTPPPPRRELMRHFAKIDADRQRAVRVFAGYGGRSLELFGHLTDGDFVVFATVSVQAMMLQVRVPRHQRVATLAVRALKRGARIAFIRPSEAVLESLSSAGYRDQLIGADFFEKGLDDFRAFAHDHLVRSGLAADQIEQALFARLGMFAAPAVPVLMPGVAVSLFGSHDGRDTVHTRLAVRLPGDEFGGLIVYPRNRLFERRTQTFARKTLHSPATDRITLARKPLERSATDHSRDGDLHDPPVRYTPRQLALQTSLAEGLVADLDRTSIFPPLPEDDYRV